MRCLRPALCSEGAHPSWLAAGEDSRARQRVVSDEFATEQEAGGAGPADRLPRAPWLTAPPSVFLGALLAVRELLPLSALPSS